MMENVCTVHAWKTRMEKGYIIWTSSNKLNSFYKMFASRFRFREDAVLSHPELNAYK
jgi:hypothetical protein